MTFVTAGLAVAGLISIGIPILIHLLSRQRRRPIEWAAMRFLLEAFKKHRRRLQIEQLLLLLVRCLIVALIGFALARPLLEDAGVLNVGGSRAVFLVIDDGLASGVTDDEHIVALENHLSQAIELIEALNAGDSVAVITASRPAKALLSPPSSDHRAVVGLLRALKPQQSPTDLPGALALVREATDEYGDNYDHLLVYLLSEFRRGSSSLNVPLNDIFKDVDRDLTLLASPPSQVAATNMQIVGIKPVRNLMLPGVLDGSGQLVVKVERHGGALGHAVSTVRLTGDGIEKLTPRVIEWEPGQSEAQVEFSLKFAVSGNREIGLTASLENDSLNADNQRHIVLELRDRIRTLLIDRRSFGFDPSLDDMHAGQWIHRALEPTEESPIEVVNVEPASLSVIDLRTADVAVLSRPDLLIDDSWTLLRDFVDHGGLLIILPPGEINVHPWVDHIHDELALPWRINLEVKEHPGGLALANEQPSSELLRMISPDLEALISPVIAYRTLPIDIEQSRPESVLVFEGGSPMVSIAAPGMTVTESEDDGLTSEKRPAPSHGLVVYIAVAPQLNWTSLPAKPLMVPLFQEIVRQGLSLTRAGHRLQVGERPALALGPVVRDLEDPEGELYPLDAISRPQSPFARAGLYTLLDQASQEVGLLSVNVDPVSGRTETQSAVGVSDWLNASGDWELFEPDDLNAALQATKTGSSLAGILLWILLALVLLETLLARWFSHAFRASAEDERFGGIRASVNKRTAKVASI